MIRYRAAWVLPIARPPIPGGVVSIERDLIVAVGPHDGGGVEDLGNVAILPGLVNAHTHLELSWLRGQVAPSASMPAWAASLLALRRRAAPDPPEPIVEAIVEGRQTQDFTVISLIRRTDLPLLWSAQEQALGIR